MAPLPVIPGVIRVDMNWNNVGGVAPHNTFHIVSDSEDLGAIADDIGDAYTATSMSPWTPLYSGYTCTTVDLTPLDGSTARTTHSLGATIAGAGTGGILPAVAVVVSFKSNQRGPRGRGRMYLGPIGEGSTGDGHYGDETALTDAWQDFFVALAATPSNISLVVASYVHAEANGITSVAVKDLLGTMRRRQDQLR